MPIFINSWLKYFVGLRGTPVQYVCHCHHHPPPVVCHWKMVDSSENCTHIVVKMHSQSLFFLKAFAFIGLQTHGCLLLDSVSRNSSHSRYLQARTSGAFYPPFLSFSCPKFDVTKGHFQQLHTANNLLQNIP